MELDYRAIGIRIRRLRKERGITQQTLAEFSNQEPSNISHIERGATKLGLPTIVNIANALEVTVDDLLCDSLKNSKAAFEREISDLLSDCTHWELKVISTTMRSLKESLRKPDSANERTNRPPQPGICSEPWQAVFSKRSILSAKRPSVFTDGRLSTGIS